MGFSDLDKPKKTLGADNVSLTSPASTFGEVLVTSLDPIAQGDFVQGINSQIFITSSFGGSSITTVSGNIELSSGAEPAGSATVNLRRRLEYRPGQGSLMRATAIFDTPDAGNAQFVGAGSSECGYFIGYFSTNFGILHSTTGAREIRRYDITTGVGSETLTVTLDGDSTTVTVDGNSTPEQTAYQLSLGDYSQVGKGGWISDAQSGSVYFISARSNSTSTGSYSVSGGGIVGSFTTVQTGEAQTNTFIPSGSFNIDKLDGTGPTGMTLDPQKGNVYQIGYQYLGYGNAFFSVEDPNTGIPAKFHMIKNANARTTPVLKDPNLSVLATSANIGGTTSVTLKSASMAAFTEGKIEKLDPKFSKSFTFTSIDTSGVYRPLGMFKANRVFNDRSSFGEFDLLRINGSNETNNKTLSLGLFLNAKIDGNVNYQYVNELDSGVSYAALDPSNSADTIIDIANLNPLYEFVVGGNTGITENIEDLSFVFGPGTELVLAIRTNASVDGLVGVSWFEQQ